MFTPGDTLGGCTILGICGSGAYGKVFLAENALGQRVAIKLFFGANDEEKTLDSLRQYIALPPSPHLLRIFHFGHENGQLFYVMEAADNAGEEGKYLPDTLALRVKRNGHLSAQEAIATCQAMAEALGTLHKAHLVHRDIKPDNVLFVNGISKLSDPDLLCNFTKTISLAGTRGYIPPEAYNTNLKNSPTTDIYALGKLLYVCATGNSPDAFPNLPPNADKDFLSKICRPTLRLCNANPNQRCQSYEEVQQVLTNALQPPSRWSSWLLRFRLNTRFRLYVIGCFLFITALLGNCFLMGRSLIRASRAKHQIQLTRHQELESFLPALSLILSDDETRTLKQLLATNTSRRSLTRSNAQAEGYLTELARQKMPPIDSQTKFTSEALLANAQCHRYLDSPLAQLFLPEAELSSYATALSKATSALYPSNGPKAGHSFATNSMPIFKFTFIPPGTYLDANGQKREIAYPFWVQEAPVTNDQYQPFKQDNKLMKGNADEMVTRVSWADVICMCAKLTSKTKESSPLPPGYAMRPILEAEYDYALTREWRRGKKPAIKEERHEYMLLEDSPGIFTPGKRDSQIKGSNKRSNLLIEQQADPNLCFRIVLAPTPDDFFSTLFINEKQFQVQKHNGHIYMGETVCFAVLSWEKWQQVAQSLGARLVEPATLDEATRLRDAFNIPRSFPMFLGIKGVDGTWHYAASKHPVTWSELPPNNQAQNKSLSLLNHDLGLQDKNARLPGIIIEWENDAAYAKRLHAWRDPASPLVKKHFEVDGHSYSLLDIRFPVYMANSLCHQAGGHLAILSDSTLCQKVLAHLKDSPGLIMVGARQNLRGWQWDNGTPLESNTDLPIHKTTASVTSPFFLGLCYFNNQWFASDHGTHLLVEFPALEK